MLSLPFRHISNSDLIDFIYLDTDVIFILMEMHSLKYFCYYTMKGKMTKLIRVRSVRSMSPLICQCSCKQFAMFCLYCIILSSGF